MRAEYDKRYRQRHPEQDLYSAAKQRAKKKNISFNIDRSDIVIPEFCPILGIKLLPKTGQGFGPGPSSPSVDRIIPELGYVKKNIRVISSLANCMKSSATNEQLRIFAKWVMENVNE
jgi:hypothetical protein